MITSDFRRIALSLDGAEEGSHMGHVDFRVGGRIFATLASEKQGFGNLMLTPEQQTAFVAEQPNLFIPLPVAGARMAPRIFAWPRPTKTCWLARCTQRGSYALRRIRNPDRSPTVLHGNAMEAQMIQRRSKQPRHERQNCAPV